MIGVVRPVSLVSSLLPMAIALLFAFISFLPLGASENLLTLGPQFILCIVFFWALRAPHLLPPWAVFMLGLGIDLFSAGPLGFWGIVYLSAYALVLLLRRRILRRGFFIGWAAFAAVAAFAAALAWGLASAYFGAVLPHLPLATSAAVTVLAFPVVAPLFGLLTGARQQKGAL